MKPESVTVKYRTVSITVYPWRHPSGRSYWRFRDGGKDVTRASLDKAKAVALTLAKSTYRGSLDLSDLTPAQSNACQRMIEADPSCKLVDEFLVWHGRRAPRKNCGEAIDEFLAAKEANRGLSTENVRTLRSHLAALAPLRGVSVGDISVNDLPAISGAPRTRRNVRAAWITFFRWCVQNEFLPHGEKTAPERLEKPSIRRKIPSTYSPAELRVLLENVSSKYRTWLPCAAFAGIRAAEVCPPVGSGKSPLDWSDFHWQRKIIIIRPETDKNGHRRVIPIMPALRHALYPISKKSGRVCPTLRPPSSSPRVGVESETTRLGHFLFGGWKRNGLRHSWISYRAAQVGLSQTAMEAGNSESEAKKSYNDAKGKDEATSWFGLAVRMFGECSVKNPLGHVRTRSENYVKLLV